jgi:hypothetical protein
MVRTVRSFADRLLETLLPTTRAQAMACYEYWRDDWCPNYAKGRTLMRVCDGHAVAVRSEPCGYGTPTCNGGMGPYGPSTYGPAYSGPCPPATCPPFMSSC